MLENIKTTSSNQYCRIKPKKLIEKDVIKNVYGVDSDIPETIYNKIQEYLNKGLEVNAILKIKIDEINSYWVSNSFIPSKNVNQHFSIKTNYLTNESIIYIQKLYNALKNIEQKVSLYYANKYLEAFLEERNLVFNELALIKT